MTIGDVDEAASAMYDGVVRTVDANGGTIDDVRINARVDDIRISVGTPNKLDGTRRELEPDHNTIALWRFNPGARYIDASGNGHHLTQYLPGQGLAVEPAGKLTTAWGALKRL